MTNHDPVAEALDSLRTRHREVTHEADRLAAAISALEGVTTGSPARTTRRFVLPPPVPGFRPSVKSMMLRLLYEADRDWSVSEILEEYECRGTPIQAKDPNNALRAAVAEANKAGTITRTALGRYKATKFVTRESGLLDRVRDMGRAYDGREGEEDAPG